MSDEVGDQRVEQLHLLQLGRILDPSTQATDAVGAIPHRWIKDPSELKEMELFHPLVADLIGQAHREDLSGPERPGLIP